MLKHWVIAFFILSLTACKSLPEKPQPPVFDPQARFSVNLPETVKQAVSNTAWWESLDTQQQADINHLLIHNSAIRIAQTNIAEATAQLNATKKAKKPSIDANTRNTLQIGDNKNNQQNLTLDFSVPLDLFDKLSQQTDTASHVLAQRLAELEHIKLQQIQTYLLALLDAIQASQTQRLILEQIETAQTLLKLTELRFAQGLTSSIDVLQQREQLAALKQQIPPIKLQQRIAFNQMQRLLGNTPAPDTTFPTTLVLPTQPAFTLKKPAQLLNKRPGLLAKNAALATQDSEYAAALKQRLPTLNLSLQGLLRLSSGDLSSLLSGILNTSFNLADNGRWQAQIDVQSAQLERAGIEYLSAWLDAVREVDDLLNQAKQNQATIELAEQRLTITQQLFAVSKQVYTQGIGDYLPVLNAIRTLQQQQRERLNLDIERQRIQVKLYTAMGF